jgi:hypothetical protein
MEYEQHDEEIDIPHGAGSAGLLEAVRGVLTLPRVQSIEINVRGKITYSFFLPKGEKAKEPVINFEKVMPYAIARNGKIEELPYPSGDAITACAELFERAERDHMYPVSFLGGEKTDFWPWYAEARGHEGAAANTREELFGIPFLIDSHMENTTLLLCTAYRRGAPITDTVKSYKITIPKVQT